MKPGIDIALVIDKVNLARTYLRAAGMAAIACNQEEADALRLLCDDALDHLAAAVFLLDEGLVKTGGDENREAVLCNLPAPRQ